MNNFTLAFVGAVFLWVWMTDRNETFKQDKTEITSTDVSVSLVFSLFFLGSGMFLLGKVAFRCL